MKVAIFGAPLTQAPQPNLDQERALRAWLRTLPPPVSAAVAWHGWTGIVAAECCAVERVPFVACEPLRDRDYTGLPLWERRQRAQTFAGATRTFYPDHQPPEPRSGFYRRWVLDVVSRADVAAVVLRRTLPSKQYLQWLLDVRGLRVYLIDADTNQSGYVE